MRGSVFHSAEEDPLVGAARRQLYKEYDYTDEAVCMTLYANLDFCHLNYKGAEKMTRWLGDYITEHYDIDTTDATDSTKAQMKENIVYYDEVVAKYAK